MIWIHGPDTVAEDISRRQELKIGVGDRRQHPETRDNIQRQHQETGAGYVSCRHESETCAREMNQI